MVDHYVQALGFQRRENTVPLGRLNLGFDAQFLRQRLGELDFETGQLAVGIDEAERWVSAFQADVDYAFVLDLLQLLTGNRLADQTGAQRQSQLTDQQIAT